VGIAVVIVLGHQIGNGVVDGVVLIEPPMIGLQWFAVMPQRTGRADAAGGAADFSLLGPAPLTGGGEIHEGHAFLDPIERPCAGRFGAIIGR
jgi:hypothetical protein